MNVFEFSWVPINWKPKSDSSRSAIYVQTTDRAVMDLFLKQHGFNKDTANVSVVTDEQYSDDDMITLHVYTMGSKHRDKLYHVVSSAEIMTSVISNISCALLDTMSFGSCALKGEIEIFARVQSLMEKLDYVYIRETQAQYREDVDDYYSYRYPGYPNYPTYEEVSRDDNEDTLNQDLYDDTIPSTVKPVPFTIEAYLSTFTREYILGKVETSYGKERVTSQ